LRATPKLLRKENKLDKARVAGCCFAGNVKQKRRIQIYPGFAWPLPAAAPAGGPSGVADTGISGC
jgi:hypothetical protein